jgi:predicted porin
MNKVAFSINGKGYIATGGAGNAGTSVWEYDPASDLWNKKTSFESTGRTEAVGFSIGGYGYVTTGMNSGYYFDDLWGFKPNDEQQSNNSAESPVSPVTGN